LLVDSVESMMMHGLANPKNTILFVSYIIINFPVFIFDIELFTQSDIYIIPQNAHFTVPWFSICRT